MNWRAVLMPVIGVVIAGVIYVFPEVKPVACGTAVALPSFLSRSE